MTEDIRNLKESEVNRCESEVNRCENAARGGEKRARMKGRKKNRNIFFRKFYQFKTYNLPCSFTPLFLYM